MTRNVARLIRRKAERAQTGTISPASGLTHRPAGILQQPTNRSHDPRRVPMTSLRRIALTVSLAALVSLPTASTAMAGLAALPVD